MTTVETEAESSAFALFMAGGYGRLIRAAIGATFIGAGLFAVQKPVGFALAAFGLLPIASGTFNLCPIAPLWGGHFFGAKYCPSKKPSK